MLLVLVGTEESNIEDIKKALTIAEDFEYVELEDISSSDWNNKLITTLYPREILEFLNLTIDIPRQRVAIYIESEKEDYTEQQEEIIKDFVNGKLRNMEFVEQMSAILEAYEFAEERWEYYMKLAGVK